MFAFNGTQLRGVKIAGEPWFVAAYVCKILDIKNTTIAVRALDADERPPYVGQRLVSVPVPAARSRN
jgi:prophage antirepressor-like protein